MPPATTAWVALALVVVVAAVAVTVLVGQRDRARRRQSLTDPLTGLGNRLALAEAAAPLLAAGTPVGLLLLDLDGFSAVNDTLGHAAGDELLVQVADALRAGTGPTGTVTRLGGDEFAVLAPAPVSAEAVDVLGRQLLAALSMGAFSAAGIQIDLQGSIGTSRSPADGTTLGDLLQHADVAMYAAKRGRLGLLAYDAATDGHSARSLELLGQLRAALADGELLLHYQPKVSGAGGRLLGFEALLRWEHPERGLLPPAEFLPMAERTNLVHTLTRWVLLTALQQASRWRAQGLLVSMSVNVSAVSLEPGLLGIVEEALALTRWAAADLVLEVTETAIIADGVRARATIDALRARGVRVSVDDFGAGFTSLAHLRGLAVHELKIDRQFISDLTDSPDDDVIVSAVIDLGHRLGLVVVAEGVETSETALRLEALGCDELQGYLFARPLPPAQALAWVRERGLVPDPVAAQAD
ncbi:putative bifunctional diguanylate cyclase/phosphodiesterase [Kineococcus rubinsiae]|uniref:putative bifunctional diguanylate cyclase/phosphodiesterase n=1 Tax=Kineococcus rubinsiae TaxID=2609562 RepID=UPI00142FF844|nr:GGDEF domain-containing phosphodiesterase [Kineococcus rubinsiae]NIZ92207.1 EAL domain-containing protein [Kineococcus rubinsiae]